MSGKQDQNHHRRPTQKPNVYSNPGRGPGGANVDPNQILDQMFGPLGVLHHIFGQNGALEQMMDFSCRHATGTTPTGQQNKQPQGERNAGNMGHNHFPIPIQKLLNELQQIKPEANYPQYKQKLRKKSVLIVQSITSLPKPFFTATIGMPPNIVDDFLNHAEQMIRRAEKGKGADFLKRAEQIHRQAEKGKSSSKGDDFLKYASAREG
ncbi:hypothetical protein D9758_006365 [Tetrapyrgos nigripes]|uniref:Uncharacterized protein n=1 Tax=Tetrapyrgos nigripes TaxID=182062 RepID=A0A8H5DA82_9AGAR|nr:hypothetical protein D9758_006365 [Tetrapyrgos nigripes]